MPMKKELFKKYIVVHRTDENPAISKSIKIHP